MTYHLFRLRNGKVWHFRFQVDGKRVQRSTRVTSESKAETLARRAYDDAVVRANGGNPVPSLAELGFLGFQVHQPIVSAAHFKSVETFLRLHLYELGPIRVDDLTTEVVELARNEHLVEHSGATANHWLRVLRLLTLWAVKRKMMVRSPWTVAMVKVQKKPRVILPLDITKAWFEAIDEATVRAPGAATAIRMMFGVGLREREAAGARWEWVDWQRLTYTPGETKGREAEPLPMPEWLVAHLLPQKQTSGLIAPRADDTPHPAGFARAPMRIANARCLTRGITPHRLRGTFATLLSEAGVPIQTIQKVLRHKSHLTTMAYLEKNMDTALKAQNKIGQIIGFDRRESGES